MKVPMVVPKAAAARAEANKSTNNARGSRPQFSFITRIPNPISTSICTSAMATCPAIVPSRKILFLEGVVSRRRKVPRWRS